MRGRMNQAWWTVAVAAALGGALASCSGGDSGGGTSSGSSSGGSSDPCAPNGTLHDDHCDCERGFIPMGLSCVPRPDAGPGGSGSTSGGASSSGGAGSSGASGSGGSTMDPDGCGPHGEEHAGHCHCDAGYFEQDGMCVAPAACVGTDDAREENDTPAAAVALTPPVSMEALHACPGDEDFFTVMLAVGQTVTVDVTFSNAQGDLDTYLWAPGQMVGEEEPAAGSEGTMDNEHFDFTATVTGAHTLLVRGYQGAEAPYRLSITVQ